MGNYISCTPMAAMPSVGKKIKITSKSAATVILPDGEIKKFREKNVAAAELMLDCPGFFVSDSRSLRAGRRFSALSADDELMFGHIYVMFPMKKVNSVVAASDVALLLLAAKLRPSSNRETELPMRELPKPEMKESTDPADGDEAGSLAELQEREYKYRLSVCRSRKPLLETIKEDAVFSR